MDKTAEQFKSGFKSAYKSMPPDNTKDSTTINGERNITMNKDIKSVRELPEHKGYSQFLKTPENPKGETDGLTPEVLSKIFQRLISDFEKDRENDEAMNWRKKDETKESTGTSSAGGYSTPLFGKIKRKIKEDKIKGGLSDNMSIRDIADKHDVPISTVFSQLQKGLKVETEHTDNIDIAHEIAMDHIFEDIKYYDKLSKIESKKSEATESTTTASSGQYDAPFPSKKRKNPLSIDGPKSIYNSRAVKDKNFPKLGGPKGKYVQVKDKCKKFPYCNQGDIKALHIFEKDYIKEAINNVMKKTNISEEYLKLIFFDEVNKNKRNV